MRSPRREGFRWAQGNGVKRIRTYNFPQGRVTDHRIGLTLYRLEGFLEGAMEESPSSVNDPLPGGSAERKLRRG